MKAKGELVGLRFDIPKAAVDLERAEYARGKAQRKLDKLSARRATLIRRLEEFGVNR
jgi:hypothetical protein